MGMETSPMVEISLARAGMTELRWSLILYIDEVVTDFSGVRSRA